MSTSQPIKRQYIVPFFLSLIINSQLLAQSVLLISANTSVYDSYKEDKIVIIKLKEDTWVNYKGKYDDYFKISNFFGKDEYYPMGIFEGYVNINSVLDTASREEFENYIQPNLVVENFTVNSEPGLPQPNTSPSRLDIDNYYLGMSENDALAIGRTTLKIESYNYQIELHYTSTKMLSVIELQGEKKDALAVDGLLKSQIEELRIFLQEKYGNPSTLINYPSFLELEEGKTYNVATWLLPGKRITLGLTENNNLFHSRMVLQKD